MQTVDGWTPIPTTCKNCGITLPSKMQHHTHIKTCKPKFPCEQCELVFESKKELIAHEKTHRRFFCTKCDTAHFFSEGALEHHTKLAHEGVIACPHCQKTFAAPHIRNEHVRKFHAKEPISCACGLEFHDEAKKDAHELTCVISRPGVTAAVKRRFAELTETTDDRGAALTQAFLEVRACATRKMALKCCGVFYANVESLKSHRRKKHKNNPPDAPTED